MKIAPINIQNNQRISNNQNQPSFGMFKVEGLIGDPKDFLSALSINGNETLTLGNSLKANTYIDQYALSPYFTAKQVEILMTKIKALAEKGITVFTSKYDTYAVQDSKHRMTTIRQLLRDAPVLAVKSGFDPPKQDRNVVTMSDMLFACKGCSLNRREVTLAR